MVDTAFPVKDDSEVVRDIALLQRPNGDEVQAAAVMDPDTGYIVKPNADGSLVVVGSISISSTPGLTNAQLRASPVPVSLDATPGLTDAQLRASPVPMSLAQLPAALVNGRLVTMDAAYDAAFGKLLVGTARDKFRDEFATFDETNNWERIQTGSGHTITVAGVANGARYLNIATGVNPGSETILLSRSTFKFPIKLAFALSMSQRIINQEVFVELVGVDGNGSVEASSSIAASANLNDATNALSLKWDGTTATNALSIARGYGISELAQASSAYLTTAATGTSPNFIPATIFEINADMEEAVFSARSVDSLAAPAGVNKRTQLLPDPAKDYKVRIRVRNLGTAPASSTDVRIHNVRVLDTTRFTVDMARHMGRTTDIADSVPAFITGAATLTANATLQASTNRAGFIASSGIWYDDSSTVLAANASFTGTSRDLIAVATATAFNSASTYAKEFRLSAESDQSGTLWLEVSRDGTNWRRIKSVATAAIAGGGQYAEIIHQPSWRYARGGFTNGATLQTRFTIGSVAVAG